MKLLRVGAMGAERPALLDGDFLARAGQPYLKVGSVVEIDKLGRQRQTVGQA